ncbi:MAG: M20/M25/M40 family metallo-hydrolase [Patescibacteria group bacterium]
MNDQNPKRKTVTVDKNRLVEMFLQLAAIRSPGFEVGAIQDWLERVIGVLFHLTATFDEAGKDQDGYQCGNLMFVLPATEGYENLPCIGLDAHVDTVDVPKGFRVTPVVDGDIIRSDGSTILGADCKCGVAAILEALNLLQKDNIPHGPIQVVFSVGEELGMIGWRNLDQSRILAKQFVVVESGELAKLLIGCAGKIKWRADFFGQASHGGEPEKGLNALLVASHALHCAQLGGILGRGDQTNPLALGLVRADAKKDEVFINVSEFQAGIPYPATNVLPAMATVSGEFRGHNIVKMNELYSNLDQVFNLAANGCKSGNGQVQGKVKMEFDIPYLPYSLQSSHPLVQSVLSAMAHAGISNAYAANYTPAATHSNIIGGLGIPAVVLGAGGRNHHSLNELLIVEEMVGAAQTLVEFLRAD